MLHFASVDPLAAIIATIALVVSAASFYLTALRRADIEIDEIAAASELHHSGYSTSIPGNLTAVPTAKQWNVCLFVSNSGAGSGVLETLRLVRLEPTESDPKSLWAKGQHWLNTSEPLPMPNMRLPLAIEAGDAKTLWLAIGLEVRARTPDDVARAVGALDRLEAHVEWTFARTRAALWSLAPPSFRPARRQVVTRELSVDVDLAGLRHSVIEYWSHLRDEHHPRLAAIARGETV